MSNAEPIIDWPKLQFQFGNEALLKQWLVQVVADAQNELALLEQARLKQRADATLWVPLQGIAALVCSPALSQRITALKQAEPLQQLAEIEQCQACFKQVLGELKAYLEPAG